MGKKSKEGHKKRAKKKRNASQTSKNTNPSGLPHKQQKGRQGALNRLAMMRERVKGGRFRKLNEELYTSESTSAFEKFQDEPELFDVYHEGFALQAETWPVNPLDIIIKRLEKSNASIIGDFGCGEARLAKTLANDDRTVHSFDLVSRDPIVTACDIASTPLEPETLDYAVYCLSLMGTNVSDFITEAHRVLKTGGELLIAEVVSRFEDVGAFCKNVEAFGFRQKKRKE
ncbi:hypothetical protein PCE1_000838 [Barthelona sp. PCE]